MDRVSLCQISEEDFNRVNDNLKDQHYVKFSYSNVIGIVYENNIVGLISMTPFIDESLSISIAILNEYRGKGIASEACNTLFDTFASEYPNVKSFMYNSDSYNEASRKAAKKLGWERTYDYDQAMEDEGAEYFIIYRKYNPYYKKANIEGKRI